MNKQKTIIGFSLMLSLVLSLSVFASEKIETRAATTSTCILRNPPNADVSWRFEGNQVIWITVENGNVLGVTATLTC